MDTKLKLSKRQQAALNKALWKIDSSNTGKNRLFKLRMKWFLLRAFAIYKRRQDLSSVMLDKYQKDLQQRLQAYFELQPQKNIEIPYYLFSFWDEVFTSIDNIEKHSDIKTKTVSKNSNNSQATSIKLKLSGYQKCWVALLKSGIDITNQSSQITQLKKTLGCISIIPIKIGNEHIQVRGTCIHYHDLYHLEVAQLERIRMGKYMVSGVHGLEVSVFHNSLKPQEYDGFLDEARIAIHEVLTRTTAFSIIKALCWMTLLMLQGINPFAVVIRHIKSMKKKQREFCTSYINSNPVKCSA
ncbi:MAG: hypothetical protein WBA39_10400 [Rivularia sp. (in: cyanobacteria)]